MPWLPAILHSRKLPKKLDGNLQNMKYEVCKVIFPQEIVHFGRVGWVTEVKRWFKLYRRASLPGVLYDRLFNCASERVKEMESRSQLGQNFSQVSRQPMMGGTCASWKMAIPPAQLRSRYLLFWDPKMKRFKVKPEFQGDGIAMIRAWTLNKLGNLTDSNK